MWIFGTPQDYSEMTQKIAQSIFIVFFFMLYVLSQMNTAFFAFLKSISFGVIYEFGGIKINFATIYLPLIFGILEHMFRFHDKISKAFQIRKRYDRKVIIAQYLNQLGLSEKMEEISDQQVEKILEFAFYKYASSTKPKIDKHVILLALNELCWFWIMLETTILFLVLSIWFLISDFSWASVVLVACTLLVLIVLLVLIYRQAKSDSKDEVREILSNNQRREYINKKIIGEVNSALHDR